MTQAPLLVVRPQPGNAVTVAAARALGLRVHGDPLFEIAPMAWDAPPVGCFDAVLIGSANVLRLGGGALRRYAALPAYVVGETTARAARDAGFTIAATGSGGLQELADRLAHEACRCVLRLAGAEHVALTVAPSTSIETVVVYEARARPLSPACATLLANRTVVLLHSAAAASHFASECQRLGISRTALSLACLGPRIAAAAGDGWASVASASRPDDTALLALAATMCQNPRFGDTDNKS